MGKLCTRDILSFNCALVHRGKERAWLDFKNLTIKLLLYENYSHHYCTYENSTRTALLVQSSGSKSSNRRATSQELDYQNTRINRVEC